MTLEDLQRGAKVSDVLTDGSVEVVDVQWHGSDALMLVYRSPTGRVSGEVLDRHYKTRLDVATTDPEVPKKPLLSKGVHPNDIVRMVCDELGARVSKISTTGFRQVRVPTQGERWWLR